MKNKYAKDLKVGDFFMHDDWKQWKVISIDSETENTITVTAENVGSKKLKGFQFGNYVDLDIQSTIK